MTLQIALWLAISLAGLTSETFSVKTANDDAHRPGVCEREGATLVGRKPLRLGRTDRTPKKVRDVHPKYPDLPAQIVGRGMWVGEVLIDEAGNVSQVWTIRKVELTPPFPRFNGSITDAIRQWEFDPLLVRGTSPPVCMAVTVSINYQ